MFTHPGSEIRQLPAGTVRPKSVSRHPTSRMHPTCGIRHPASDIQRAGSGLAIACALVASACAAGTPFSEQNARAHVNQLAGAIGSRPAGSDANRRAREYLVDQLRFYGYTVRVQEADAHRPELGLSAHVFNIIAIVPGASPDALGLMAHYDSRAETPGAGDDSLGVAVVLECARLLAARRDRRHAVMVLLTDAEEEGLMGAAALMRDPEVTARLRAYINLDAVGADGPVPLFQTGPGNGWLVGTWARAARAPRGGSYQAEVYRRLPSDTDFSVLMRAGIPGLNFAAVGDGYAYHTARDTPERLTARAIREMGATTLSTAEALDRTNLAQRSSHQAVYFDLAGTRALALRPVFSRALSVLAIVLATVAVVRTTRVTVSAGGAAGAARTFAWALVGTAVVAAALVGVTALLRDSREVLHPWYAHPARFWVLLMLTLVIVIEILLRVGDRLPRPLRAVRHPAAVWMVTLVCWLALTIGAEGLAPSAAYLWSVPLLVLAAVAALAPAADRAAARVGALLVIAASGAMWLPEGREMLRFGVPMFGRLSIVTPIAAYPAALLVMALMVVPGILALDVATLPPLPDARLTLGRRRVRALLTPALLVALSVAFAACYLAEAYTFDRPLQRAVQYVADHPTGRAVWEVAGVEPGLDLDLSRGAPAGWVPSTGPLLPGVRATPLSHPFAFRAPGVVEPAPVEATLQSSTTAAGSVQIEITARTGHAGLIVLFAAPPGVVPIRPSLPGIVRDGRWVAAFAAAPAGATVFSAECPPAAAARAGEWRVGTIDRGLPGGEGWLRQPAWLASARTVWHARSLHLIAPVTGAARPPLR